MENYAVGKIMSMKREALGCTRKELCKRCNNMSEKTLARLEKEQVRVRRSSIEELLSFYRQPSHTIYPILNLENPSMGRMYNEILDLMFQRNYGEARLRLGILERYIKEKSETSVRYFEVLKRELLYYMGEKVVDGEDTVCFLERRITEMMPEGADLEKWPLNKQEMHTFLVYFNVLTLEGKYEKTIPLLRKLLVNMERGYQNVRMFADFYGYFAHKLIRALRKTGQCEEIEGIAEKSLMFCRKVGNIQNTYGIQSELLCYFEENEFFHDEKIKEQCLENAEKMYYLCKFIGDKESSDYFRRFLKRMCTQSK